MDVAIQAGGFDGAITHDSLTELSAAINSSKLDVNVASGGFVQTAVVTGQATVPTGTATAIASTQTLYSGITVVSDPDNTAIVYVGPTGISVTTGFPLAVGAGFTFSLSQAATLFSISGTASQKVFYVAM